LETQANKCGGLRRPVSPHIFPAAWYRSARICWRCRPRPRRLRGGRQLGVIVLHWRPASMLPEQVRRKRRDERGKVQFEKIDQIHKTAKGPAGFPPGFLIACDDRHPPNSRRKASGVSSPTAPKDRRCSPNLSPSSEHSSPSHTVARFCPVSTLNSAPSWTQAS
jgi:hypothetical protein